MFVIIVANFNLATQLTSDILKKKISKLYTAIIYDNNQCTSAILKCFQEGSIKRKSLVERLI